MIGEDATAPTVTTGNGFSPWGDIPPPLRVIEQGKLVEFVDRELRVGWPNSASGLEACWPAHEDVCLQLRSLRLGLREALIPQVNEDGTVGWAEVERMGKWEEELHQDRDRWAESFKACHGTKPCPRMERPEAAAADAAAWHAKEVEFAARAWGQEPVPPPVYLEPYQQAANAAEHQASRKTEQRSEAHGDDGAPGPGEPDPFPTW